MNLNNAIHENIFRQQSIFAPSIKTKMMKKLILIFAIVITGTVALAQECKDVIYPTGGEAMIFDCCITEVKDGNIVYFTIEGVSHMVAATSIIKDGVEIPLHKSSEETPAPVIQNEFSGNYNYYQAKYFKAKRSRNTGMLFTILGSVLFVTGAALVANNQEDAAGVVLLGSFFSFNIGFPVWMAGAAKTRANRMAMEEVKRNPNGLKSISLGATNDGFGLRFSL